MPLNWDHQTKCADPAHHVTIMQSGHMKTQHSDTLVQPLFFPSSIWCITMKPSWPWTFHWGIWVVIKVVNVASNSEPHAEIWNGLWRSGKHISFLLHTQSFFFLSLLFSACRHNRHCLKWHDLRKLIRFNAAPYSVFHMHSRTPAYRLFWSLMESNIFKPAWKGKSSLQSSIF